MDEEERERRNRAYRGIHAVCKEAGIEDKSDRIELAKALLRLPEGLTSYTELPTEDLEDIYFALRGWRTIQELRLANGALEAETAAYRNLFGEEEAPPGG